MIRMSPDKEAVLPLDGRGDTTVPEGPTVGGGQLEGEGGVDRVGGVMIAPPLSCLGQSGFTGSLVLMEQPNPNRPKTGTNPGRTQPLKTRNGLQPASNKPQDPPPGQQQRMGKRRYSLGGGFKHPGFGKRRRCTNSDSQSDPVLPSNFLLGGNIFDPLNLNSLLDEEVSRALNAETPKSSPLPARARDPVEILVPRDITDPLNLKSGRGEGEEGGVLVSPIKNRKRHRGNRHHGGGLGTQSDHPTQAEGSVVETVGEAGGGVASGGGVLGVASIGSLFPAAVCVTGELAAVPEANTEGSMAPQSPLPYELNTTINCRDEVVPPILPRRHTHPPLNSASKLCPHGDSVHRQRKRWSTTLMRSDPPSVTPTPALTVTFHTPLVPGSGLRGQRSEMKGQQQPQNSCHHKPKEKKNRFQHGNFSRYYGYHGYYGYHDGQVGPFEDPRLGLLQPDWFREKTVLDIGCGAGHLTLAIARHFNPAHILGIDLDMRLVHAARQNIRHFLSERLTREALCRGEMEGEGEGETDCKHRTETADRNSGRSKTKMVSSTTEEEEEDGQKEEEGLKEECSSLEELKRTLLLLSPPSGPQGAGRPLLPFPISFRVSRGPIAAPPLPVLTHSSPLNHGTPGTFPNNISFMTGDYLNDREMLVHNDVTAVYDVILCLGVTKWVHLHEGDGGVVRMFWRMYRHLRPGGMLLLEPQPWISYCHSKKSTEMTYRNYQDIRLRPENFSSYLTSTVSIGQSTSSTKAPPPGSDRNMPIVSGVSAE
ncbi:7SK snRNA methylphosphate capping enzyme isoform X1 [Esox lucius]|uniref:7SK snRNA methylphosphate capping enzyme isoform X1 n=1 Tax=Esox lucius TaxID=8010 RepID=UPI0014776C13|nr:7SK snRNA methylphosphate capping enzyme isoform X1 [Esox lucius]